MAKKNGIDTCRGRKLEFSRGLSIELLERVKADDMIMLDLLNKDCMNILNYKYHYREIEPDRFALHFGKLTLEIFVTRNEWIVTNLVHTVEIK